MELPADFEFELKYFIFIIELLLAFSLVVVQTYLCIAYACGIESPENQPSKFSRKIAWKVEERARGKHAHPKELCEDPKYIIESKKPQKEKHNLFGVVILL